MSARTDLEFRDGKWRVKAKPPRLPRDERKAINHFVPGSLEAAVADALRAAWGRYDSTGDWYDAAGISEMTVAAVRAMVRWHSAGAPADIAQQEIASELERHQQ